MDEPKKRAITVVHSKAHTDALIHAGWRLRTMLRVSDDEEPYVYVLEWHKNPSRSIPVFRRGAISGPAHDPRTLPACGR
jgi:hypothetical protein